jgi:hypothetical protein
MTLGKILFLLAAILPVLAGIGSTLLPSPLIWALFCIALGLFLDGFNLTLSRR